MFEHVAEDYIIYGRTLRNRAFWGMALYRFGRWSMALRFGPLRWANGKIYGALNVVAPIFTGVFIGREMIVGRRFHIVHPGMVIIHPDVRFGDDCGVMHGITIGASTTGPGGVPTIGNNVFIGTGAVVLGAITIGDGARIAANSLVLCDVPAGAMAIGVPAKVYPNAAASDTIEANRK